jgi:hypothetical protein
MLMPSDTATDGRLRATLGQAVSSVSAHRRLALDFIKNTSIARSKGRCSGKRRHENTGYGTEDVAAALNDANDGI